MAEGGAHHQQGVLPSPPDVPRRIRLGRGQLAGLALLVLGPALAIAGLLDPVSVQATDTRGPLTLTVTYPSRMRYRTNQWVRVAIILPGPSGPFQVELGTLQSGQTRQVGLQLQAEAYGWRRGQISVRPGVPAGSDEAAVTIQTLVLP